VKTAERQSLFVIHHPALRRFVRRHAPSKDEVEDLLQDVAVVLLDHHSGPLDACSFLSWCQGVARYLVAHRRRSFARWSVHVASLAVLGEAAMADATFDNPEHVAAARQQMAARLDMLDETTRMLFVARFVAGETPSEIAERWRVSPASMRMRLMRLRSALRAVTDEAMVSWEGNDG